jgi:predicted dehydrogenase
LERRGAHSGPEVAPAIQARRAQHEASGKRRCGRARFRGRHAFDNYQALVSHPEVDLVVVSVKVPHHFELVSAVIAAGKFVYREWPLGNGLDEAIRMADLARGKLLSTTVGLQARFSPVIRYVRDLIAEGHIGMSHRFALVLRRRPKNRRI